MPGEQELFEGPGDAVRRYLWGAKSPHELHLITDRHRELEDDVLKGLVHFQRMLDGLKDLLAKIGRTGIPKK